MGEYLDLIPVEMQEHIRQITKTSGLPDTEESVDMIAQGWLEKRKRFEKILARMSMEEVDLLEQGRARLPGHDVLRLPGQHRALAGTGRTVQYASIGLRQDVPEAATKEGSELGADVRVEVAGHVHAGPHPELRRRFSRSP